MEKKANDVEICESCEVHENLLKIVNETIPAETELYDLAEYSRSSETPQESEFCMCSLKQRYVSAIWRGIEYDTVSYFPPAQDTEAEQAGQEQTGR